MELDSRKKPAPDFVIRLEAEGLRPWDVPMRHLARVMDAVQRLVEQQEDSDTERALARTDDTDRANPVDRVLRLIDIKRGSAAYPVAIPRPEPAIRLFREAGISIKRPESAPWTQSTLSSIKELSEVANALGCKIEIRQPGAKGKTYGDVLATITSKTYECVSQTAFIVGETSVYATVERVGGATEMHCGIRVPNQSRRMVICRVENEDLVRQLGQFIYQEVTLVGKATWLRHNFELRSMIIHSLEPPRAGSLNDALKRIHDAGGSSWDSVVDPDRLLSEYRGK